MVIPLKVQTSVCIKFFLKYFSCYCGFQLPILIVILRAISSSWMLQRHAKIIIIGNIDFYR